MFATRMLANANSYEKTSHRADRMKLVGLGGKGKLNAEGVAYSYLERTRLTSSFSER
jgi:hypothetical protein